MDKAFQSFGRTKPINRAETHIPSKLNLGDCFTPKAFREQPLYKGKSFSNSDRNQRVDLDAWSRLSFNSISLFIHAPVATACHD